MIRSNTGEVTGPLGEEEFQEKLRAGEIPFFYDIRSSAMTDWKPLVKVISEDNSFHRASTTPPPPPPEDK